MRLFHAVTFTFSVLFVRVLFRLLVLIFNALLIFRTIALIILDGIFKLLLLLVLVVAILELLLHLLLPLVIFLILGLSRVLLGCVICLCWCRLCLALRFPNRLHLLSLSIGARCSHSLLRLRLRGCILRGCILGGCILLGSGLATGALDELHCKPSVPPGNDPKLLGVSLEEILQRAQGRLVAAGPIRNPDTPLVLRPPEMLRHLAQGLLL
mmetsp:Transcript_56814/g.122287  ORF Transcript_56814/g.122287 Transcript_56814/m.122287 type:complete len:211 (-) Transcript_56814:67-699(-)